MRQPGSPHSRSRRRQAGSRQVAPERPDRLNRARATRPRVASLSAATLKSSSECSASQGARVLSLLVISGSIVWGAATVSPADSPVLASAVRDLAAHARRAHLWWRSPPPAGGSWLNAPGHGSNHMLPVCGDHLRPVGGGNGGVAPVPQRHARRPPSPQQDPRQPHPRLGGRDMWSGGGALPRRWLLRRRAPRLLARSARSGMPALRGWSPESVRASGCASITGRPRAKAYERRFGCPSPACAAGLLEAGYCRPSGLTVRWRSPAASGFDYGDPDACWIQIQSLHMRPVGRLGHGGTDVTPDLGRRL